MSFPPLRWFRDEVTVEGIVGHTAVGEVYSAPVVVRCSVDRRSRNRNPPDSATNDQTAEILVPLTQPGGSVTITPKLQSKVTLADGTVTSLTQLSVEQGPNGRIVMMWRVA